MSNPSTGMLRYGFRMTVIALLCAAIAGKAAAEGVLPLNPWFRYLPPLGYLAFSLLVHRMLLQSLEGKPSAFVHRFMATQGIKMFVHLMVLVVVGFLNRSIAVPFTLYYASLYLVFTVSDVIALFPLVRKTA